MANDTTALHLRTDAAIRAACKQREQERVRALLAVGLNGRQIATRLSVSPARAYALIVEAKQRATAGAAQ